MKQISMVAICIIPLFVACGGGVVASAHDSDETTERVDVLLDEDRVPDSEEETVFDESSDETDRDVASDDDFISNDEDTDDATDENVAEKIENRSVGLIVTTDAFKKAFEKLAHFHSLTGVPTEIVTIEEICADNTLCHDEDPANDTVKAIKEYVMEVEGLKYLLLGGDDADVPTRVVYDEYKDELEGVGLMQTDIHTDYYYADFSDWDSNNNGIYAEEIYNDGKGTPVDFPDYRPEISVGRLPVSTVEEIEQYTERVISYSTAFDVSKIKSLLFLSNVAAEYMGVKFDSAEYFEQPGRTGDLIPPDFNITKMYATKVVPGGQKLTMEGEIREFEAGHNMIVHLGHGNYYTAASSPTGENSLRSDVIVDFENSNYPIFISCACDAGRYFTESYTFKDDPEQKVYEDAAGEYLLNAPKGGAIAYIGNSDFGLGLAGGNQFIDALIYYTFQTRELTLGDAMYAGHAYMPDHDDYTLPVVGITKKDIVYKDSYEWTQKVVVLFGDPMLSLWLTDRQLSPQLTIDKISGDAEKTLLKVSITPFFPGTLTVDANGELYTIAITENNTEFVINDSFNHVAAGYSTPDALHSWGEQSW